MRGAAQQRTIIRMLLSPSEVKYGTSVLKGRHMQPGLCVELLVFSDKSSDDLMALQLSRYRNVLLNAQLVAC